MLKNKKLFVIDLDGTALIDRDTLHPELKRSVQAAQLEGHMVSIMTGRPLKGCISFHEELGLKTLLGTLNGNMIYDTLNKKIIEVCKFNSAPFVAFLIIEKNIQHVVDYAYQYKDIVHSTHNVVKLMTDWYHKRPYEDILDEHSVPNEIESGFIMINPSYSNEVEKFFLNYKEIVLHKWEELKEGKQVYELFNSQCTKATAVKIFQKEYNISNENTHVFGDGNNDVSMFEHSVNSYAVFNAHPNLKSKATKILKEKNTENAVGKEMMNILKKDL